jgi:hypothetical protein
MITKKGFEKVIENAQRPKMSWEDMNEEFQYLWNKYERIDWKKENLAAYCGALEFMIMNFLVRNKALDRSTQLFR